MSSGSDDVKQLLGRSAGDQPAASAQQPWDQLQQVFFSPEVPAHIVAPHAPESKRLQQTSLEESTASDHRAAAVHTVQSRLEQQTNTAAAAWIIHNTAPAQSRQTKKSREWWPRYHNPQMQLIRQPHLSGATIAQQPTSGNGAMLTLDLRALAASQPGAAAAPLPQAPATCEAPVPESSAPWPSADTCSLPSLSGSTPSAAPAPTLSIRPGSAASVGSPASATPGRALYSMVLLDASSRQRLLERVPPAFQLVSADHMTICYKPDQAHLDGLPIGRTVRLAAVGIARDDKRQAVAVEVQDPGIDVSVSAPHVTISTGQRASAKSAGSLLESCRGNPGVRQACYTPLEPPLLLQGTVCLKLTNGHTAFSKEAGTLLPSKTNSARPSSASGLMGRKGRENSDAGDCSQGWKRQGVGEEQYKAVVLRRQEEGAPAKSQRFGAEELTGAGATAPPSATPTDESSRSPARPHARQQPAPATPTRPHLSSAAAGDRAGPGGAAPGHDSSSLDELLGRLGISRQLLGASRDGTALPVANWAAQQAVGGASGSAVQHKLGRSAESNFAEHAAEGSRLPELEALLRAWTLGGSSDAASDSQAPSTTEQADCSQCFGSEQPMVEVTSTAQASVLITPAAAAAGISDEVLDELESGAAPAAEDAESSFWEQLMADAGTEATEHPQSSEQTARTAPRQDSACNNDSRASKQSTGESSQLGKRDNLAATGAPGHVPLKPKRPGREAVDRLWCPGRNPPDDDDGAATESPNSPQLLPAKLLRRGEAPADRPLPSTSSGDWLEVSAESSTVPAVAAETGREEPGGLSNSQDSILEQPRQPVGFKISRPSQTSSKVASASRKMVMFMEEHPDSPAADVGKAAERLADELVGQVYELPVEAFADSDVEEEEEEEEEDVTGDPWWAARKLPSKLQETAGKHGAAPNGEGRSPAPAVAAYRMTPGKAASKAGPKRKKPKPPSRSPAAQTSEIPNLVSSMMDVWHLAGKAGEWTHSEAGDAPGHAAQELPRRQILSLPVGALQRDSNRHPAAKAQSDQHQRQQRQSEPARAPQKSTDEASKSSKGCDRLAALGPICLTAAGPGDPEAGQEGPADDLGAEGLSHGVGQLVAKFPSIDRTVAHLTLKSHGGDVEEAISFLELTSLTATPGQLTQLGLLPTPERSPPIRVPQPAANGTSSRDGGQAASPAADVTAVDGSLADRVLAAADPGEAIELAISGASITLAERQRLQAESDEARRQWERHYQAKGILNEAAAAAEAKGQKPVAQLLRAQAHEQGKLGAQWRRQCNNRAFAGSNHGNTNTVKVDLHGMSVDEAIAKLEQHVHSLSGLSSATFILQVITGAGKHSLGGIARLQPAVIDYARTRGLRWGREPGNAGQINVTLSGVQQT